MTTKIDELNNPNSCLNKASDDEPIFVIRAHDPLAVQTVMYWARLASAVHEKEKVQEAMLWADRAETWLLSRLPKK